MSKVNEIAETNETTTKGWLKRGGILVFMFFLLKGIGWLVLIGLVAFGLMDETTVQKIKDAIPFF
jgi:hypothetical protein